MMERLREAALGVFPREGTVTIDWSGSYRVKRFFRVHHGAMYPYWGPWSEGFWEVLASGFASREEARQWLANYRKMGGAA